MAAEVFDFGDLDHRRVLRESPHLGPPPQAGEGARIHVFSTRTPKDVDGRDKPGHDEERKTGSRFCNAALSCCAALGTRDQLSRKLRSFLDLDGCFSFRSAFASICLIRSLVTLNCWPTSSRVWSVFMPMPKRMRRTRSSGGVSEARTRVVVSRKLLWIAASMGRIAFLSSMKSPRCESSSSPTGVSSDSGSFAIFRTL